MKNLLKSAVLICMLGYGGKAEAVSLKVADLVKTIMKTPALFCEKGKGTSQITIRSGQGKLCLNKAVAALAVAVCGHREDFWNSHCGKYSMQVLHTEKLKAIEAAKKAVAKFKGQDLADFKSLMQNKKGLEASNKDGAEEIEELAEAAPAA